MSFSFPSPLAPLRRSTMGEVRWGERHEGARVPCVPPLSLPHILVSSHSLPSPLTHSVHRLSTFASSPRSLRVSYGMEWSVTRRGVKGRWRGGIRLETERDVERRDRRRPPPFPLHTAPYHLTTFCPPLGSFLITSHSIRSVSSCSVTHYILSHPSPSDRPFGPPFGSDGDGRGKDNMIGR